MNEYPNAPYQTAPQGYPVTPGNNGQFSAAPTVTIKTMTKEEKEKRVNHFRFFSLGSILYAIFYTFCLYKNASGITYPFFIGGTLFYFFLSLKKLGLSAKKDSAFYVISLLLLGISVFCTDSSAIINMNKMGIFVLAFVLMIHNFHEDNDWSFSKYFAAIFQTAFGSIGEIGRPFSDLSLYQQSKKEEGNTKNSTGKLIAIGLLISVPLMIFVLLLLCSADMVFASVMDKLFFNIRLPQNLFGICFSLLFSFFASYCIITRLEKRKIKKEAADRRTGEPVIAITVTSILSIIYMLFSGIQIVYLFAGGTLPNGYSYAEYAREGFFQLLFICLMNLGLVLICLSRFKENKLLKAILTVISLCTYIMTASSAMRMILYIQYYYLTFLRIFVLWSLLVIFLLMTGVLIHVYRQKFPLFKYSMVVVTVLYIALSFSHPDYWIAKCNISFMTDEETDFFTDRAYSDTYYLSRLSADAAPVLLSEENPALYGKTENTEGSYLPDWITDYVENIAEETEDMSLRTFNLSRYAASRYLTTP